MEEGIGFGTGEVGVAVSGRFVSLLAMYCVKVSEHFSKDATKILAASSAFRGGVDLWAFSRRALKCENPSRSAS